MDYDLKENVDNIFELCDAVQDTMDWEYSASLREIARVNILEIASYISASDGTISYKEAKVINDYLDIPFKPEDINEFIMDNNIYSTEFENDVPLSIKIMTDVDNTLYTAGVEISTPASELLFILMQGIAEEVMKADGVIDPQEEEDFRIITTTIDNYLTDNLYSRGYSVETGIKKNTGVAAPKKNGSVIAPRKR